MSAYRISSQKVPMSHCQPASIFLSINTSNMNPKMSKARHVQFSNRFTSDSESEYDERRLRHSRRLERDGFSFGSSFEDSGTVMRTKAMRRGRSRLKSPDQTRKEPLLTYITGEPTERPQMYSCAYDPRDYEDYYPRTPYGDSLAADVQSVITPGESKDITLHFELDFEDDIGDDLEEFIQLTRLGYFSAADTFFQQHLEERLDQIAVAFEYSNMLWEQGSYYSLGKLLSRSFSFQNKDREGRKGLWDRWVPLIESRLNGAVRRNAIDLIAAMIDAHGKFHGVYGGSVNHFEIQLFCRKLALLRTGLIDTSALEDLWPERPGYYISAKLFDSLLASGRFWDVGNLLRAVMGVEGPEGTWKIFVGGRFGRQEAIMELLQNWTADGSATAYLALLETLVVLSGYPYSMQGTLFEWEMKASRLTLEHARPIAIHIRTTWPSLMRSRPYLRWILAEAELNRVFGTTTKGTGSSLANHLSRFPGFVAWNGLLPIYVPLAAENPGWPLIQEDDHVTTLVEKACNTAHELGDSPTEVLCLQELICRSSEPLALFERLADIQKGLQGDANSYKQTCLARYLLTKDETSRKRLLELLHQGPIILSNHQTSGTRTRWLQVMIERALRWASGFKDLRLERTATELMLDLPAYLFKKLEEKAWLGLPFVPPDYFEHRFSRGRETFTDSAIIRIPEDQLIPVEPSPAKIPSLESPVDWSPETKVHSAAEIAERNQGSAPKKKTVHEPSPKPISRQPTVEDTVSDTTDSSTGDKNEPAEFHPITLRIDYPQAGKHPSRV